ncbi:MAG: hypothetical protein ACI89L_001940 [Phycisphaerales bacterium]|jgi:hypothetical protein
MAQRRFHYERAFERYLRAARIPYVAVDEAKKALLPPGCALRINASGGEGGGGEGESDMGGRALKSFDFVVYGESSNLLVEVKGRKLPALAPNSTRGVGRRLENWVSADDVESLLTWRRLFGPGFDAAFVFVYWCEDQPPDGLFDEVLECSGSWYTTRAVDLDSYRASMRVRSPRWRTVDLPREAFDRVARPFAPPGSARFGPPPTTGPLSSSGPLASNPGLDAGPGLPAFEPLSTRIG